MGQAYVDDHRVLLYKHGAAVRDITEYCSSVQATDTLDALAVEVQFAVNKAQYDPAWVPFPKVAPGDKVRIVNHDSEVFSGVVIDAGLDGACIAYDRGYYLNESEVILQCSGIAADEAIRQLCKKAGITAGDICSLPTKITEVWVGDTPSSILDDILEACTLETGKQYHSRVRDGKLTVRVLGTAPIKAYHKPAANLAAFDITSAKGKATGSDTMDGLRNAVKIVAESDGKVYTGAVAGNSASIDSYGYLQRVVELQSGDDTAQLGQKAKTLLQNLDRITGKRSIDDMWGCDEVESGTVLQFDNSAAFGFVGRYRVTSVTHTYGAEHKMALELESIDVPRAADSASDKVSVQDIPADVLAALAGDDTGGASGDGTASAFVSVAAGEVGVSESPAGSNKQKYGKAQGQDGVAWCALFVGWCATQSGADIPHGWAAVSSYEQHYRSLGKYHAARSCTPRPGWLMIQSGRHIGIVESASGGSVTCIEGNYSNRVARVTRSLGEVSGFCATF